ncbi:hypothetical protein ARMGADRAFT_1038481 [Armillaria gallica]|uniref:Uncharacterized protein n=1 Tax=Armillaria gallica TaxID=47427 RepID=A0A2H3CL11_ARMGA|nr:hypothetical protein ARMGADRAFT_1038481 [Armillaria gallica]
MTLFMLKELWSGIQGALLLQLSSQILQMVKIGLVHGSPEIGTILKALTMQIISVIFAALLHWASFYIEQVTPILKAWVKACFELLLMQAQLKMDLPTSQEYRKATQLLGGLSDQGAQYQYMARTLPAWDIIDDILSDIPIPYSNNQQSLDWAIQGIAANINFIW